MKLDFKTMEATRNGDINRMRDSRFRMDSSMVKMRNSHSNNPDMYTSQMDLDRDQNNLSSLDRFRQECMTRNKKIDNIEHEIDRCIHYKYDNDRLRTTIEELNKSCDSYSHVFCDN